MKGEGKHMWVQNKKMIKNSSSSKRTHNRKRKAFQSSRWPREVKEEVFPSSASTEMMQSCSVDPKNAMFAM